MLAQLYTMIFVALTAGCAVLASPVASQALSARVTHTGTATRYLQRGNAGSCGQVHSDQDHIVALQTSTYANGIHCGRSLTITDTKTGKTSSGVVADVCPGCVGSGSIDLSEGLFEVFAPAAAGVFPVTWNFNSKI
ncbi:RlpA-like double-psi beta-barrel-protein domain-containing protein-containing protein [Gautieria morchelliformis]|nr:RlpA-like double-psi beta-barrel-protein domain-containing protein-containing protein [Gautieria morchelliformis]